MSTSCGTGPDCRPNLLQTDNDVQGLGSTSHPSFGIQDSNFDCNTPPRLLRRIQASESKIRILIAGDLHAGFVASTSHTSFGIRHIQTSASSHSPCIQESILYPSCRIQASIPSFDLKLFVFCVEQIESLECFNCGTDQTQ